MDDFYSLVYNKLDFHVDVFLDMLSLEKRLGKLLFNASSDLQQYSDGSIIRNWGFKTVDRPYYVIVEANGGIGSDDTITTSASGGKRKRIFDYVMDECPTASLKFLLDVGWCSFIEMCDWLMRNTTNEMPMDKVEMLISSKYIVSNTGYTRSILNTMGFMYGSKSTTNNLLSFWARLKTVQSCLLVDMYRAYHGEYFMGDDFFGLGEIHTWCSHCAERIYPPILNRDGTISKLSDCRDIEEKVMLRGLVRYICTEMRDMTPCPFGEKLLDFAVANSDSDCPFYVQMVIERSVQLTERILTLGKVPDITMVLEKMNMTNSGFREQTSALIYMVNTMRIPVLFKMLRKYCPKPAIKFIFDACSEHIVVTVDQLTDKNLKRYPMLFQYVDFKSLIARINNISETASLYRLMKIYQQHPETYGAMIVWLLTTHSDYFLEDVALQRLLVNRGEKSVIRFLKHHTMMTMMLGLRDPKSILSSLDQHIVRNILSFV